jgi:hypothetical protein
MPFLRYAGTHPAASRFPGKREMPVAQPLPSASSTWSLVASDGQPDGITEPRPDAPRQDTLDGGEPMPQDPSVGDPQVGRREPRGQPSPPTNDSAVQNGKPSPQAEDKPSRFKRAVRRLKNFMKSKLV